MAKIAVLYICTGKYIVLWKEFYKSFERFFLPFHEKNYYVFTDAEHVEYDNDERIHIIKKEPLKWPYSTLLRFHMFNEISDKLLMSDYVFFFNANSMAVDNICEDMILPRKEKGEEIVVVKHPAFRNKKPYQFTYDRNFKSMAYIPYGRGRVYVQGSLIGGTSDAFVKMSKTISSMIDKDLKNKIIALWHDESYLNKYILNNHNYRLLGPEFATPMLREECMAHIHLRPKSNYFDVTAIKDQGDATSLSKFNKSINDYIYNLLQDIEIARCDAKNVKHEKGELRSILFKIKHYLKAIVRL